jgi:hypothetical protein
MVPYRRLWYEWVLRYMGWGFNYEGEAASASFVNAFASWFGDQEDQLPRAIVILCEPSQ